MDGYVARYSEETIVRENLSFFTSVCFLLLTQILWFGLSLVLLKQEKILLGHHLSIYRALSDNILCLEHIHKL